MLPSTSRDEVRLRINGVDFYNWTANSITMSIDNVADGFSLSCPFDATDLALRVALKPFGYQAVQLYIGDDLLLTGRIERLSPSFSSSGRVVTVEGRSKTGILADVSVEDCSDISGLSLSTIARKLLTPFGIVLRADADTDPIEMARAEYGQSIYEFLNSLAGPRNILLNCSYTGQLVFTYARSLSWGAPVAALVEGKGILLSVQSSFDGTKRFSSYSVASQFAGEGVIGSVSDSGVPIKRPKVYASGDLAQDPAKTAARQRALAIADSESITATVSGWRRPDDGKRWAERQVVTLKAPSTMVYTETAFIVAGVTLKIDPSEGKVSELRLMLPDAYSVDEQKAVPWD